jgi:ATP-dependent helicase IRC3
MQYELREYQKECIENIFESQKHTKKALIQLPTGAGKTVVFWSYLKQNPKKTLLIVPSLQLGEQVMLMGLNFFSSKEISCRFGRYRQEIKHFHICTIQSLCNKELLKKIIEAKFDIIIVDEAHRAASKSFMNVFKHINNDPYILGFTATPFRNDAISLSSILGEIVYSKDLLDLIHEGYLCDLEGYRIKTSISIKKATFFKGDFCSGSLFKILNTNDRNSLILDSFKKHCLNLKTLIFAINVEHCYVLERFFLSEGFKAKAIHGLMPLNLRMEILDSFKKGTTQILINTQLLTEGFDAPWIEALILARPTTSKLLYTQMIGRGVRLYENKKVCKVIDMADNYHSLIGFHSLASDAPLQALNTESQDGLTLTYLAKNKNIIFTSIDNVKEEKINFFLQENSLLANSMPDYLKNECEYDFLNYQEALFLIWKKHQLIKMRKYGNNKRKS